MTDEELIERLRDLATKMFQSGNWGCDLDTTKVAADRIEELVKERDEAINQLGSARHSVDVLERRVAHFMSSAERLEAERDTAWKRAEHAENMWGSTEVTLTEAINILEDALQEAGDDYPGSTMQSWCQQQIKQARKVRGK